MHRIALLIDAENIPAYCCAAIFETLKDSGTVCERLAFADWTQGNLKQWQAMLSKYAIESKHIFNSCNGKNVADMALTIEAMDLLHSGNFDVFALASSDSDFGPLVQRLRQSGNRVIGFGEGKATAKFKELFDEFHLVRLPKSSAKPAATKPSRKWKPEEVKCFEEAFGKCEADEQQSVSFAELNKHLVGFKRRIGVFSSRSKMLDASDIFEWLPGTDKKRLRRRGS